MRITFSILIMAFLVGLLSAIGWWTWSVLHTFSVQAPVWQTLLRGLLHTFTDPRLRPIALFSILKGFAPVAVALYVLNDIAGDDEQRRVVRGTKLVTSAALKRLTSKKPRTSGVKSQIQLAHVPMPEICETGHTLVTGTTGSGKSVAIDSLMETILDRGDRLIIVDPNAHALARFAKKGDKVANTFDRRSFGWSPFNEIRKQYDVERLAKSIVPNTADSSTQQWHAYAQNLLAEIMRALMQAGEANTKRLIYWSTQAPAPELAKFLAGSTVVGLFEPGAEKALASTRFILTHHIGVFQHLRPGRFSFRAWLESGQGNLYITWRHDMLETMRPLISAWVDIIISTILTLPENQRQRLWLILDELASLLRLTSLEDGLTKSRKHNLRIVGSLQSTAQLDSLYGSDNAKTLRSCFRNLLSLGCSNADPATAEIIAQGLGQSETERTQFTRNTQQGKTSLSTTRQRSIELAVLPAELMKLAPLHGYLKFAGNYPIAHIQLTAKDRPIRCKPFVER